ncbi:MAG: DNA double-strand break repair nuclease NurA [Promethearchaeota archaeon]
MPLDFEEVWNQFISNELALKNINFEQNRVLKKFRYNAKKYLEGSYNDIINELNNVKGDKGAIPTEEFKHGLIVEFPHTFNNHNEMLDWALENVKNNVTIASDGSQIFPLDELNIPIALIQVVLFANFHRTEPNSYQIERKIKLIPPQHLIYRDSLSKTTMVGKEPVDTLRFKLEMDVLSEMMDNLDNQSPRPDNVFFLFDGSLILSFIRFFADRHKEIHFKSLKKGIMHSKLYEYPLVGYVDSSAAKDVLLMLSKLDPIIDVKDPYISDSGFLEYYINSTKKYQMKWGDRTCTFICDRNDPIYKQYPSKVDSKIAFFYMKISSTGLARIEFPEWCLKKLGMVEKIADILRIESIVGNGYPLTIDQCHHRTVIKGNDRLKFMRLFQKFGEKHNINVKLKNKSRAKLKFLR